MINRCISEVETDPDERRVHRYQSNITSPTCNNQSHHDTAHSLPIVYNKDKSTLRYYSTTITNKSEQQQQQLASTTSCLRRVSTMGRQTQNIAAATATTSEITSPTCNNRSCHETTNLSPIVYNEDKSRCSNTAPPPSRSNNNWPAAGTNENSNNNNWH